MELYENGTAHYDDHYRKVHHPKRNVLKNISIFAGNKKLGSMHTEMEMSPVCDE
jgi:hypothetical protein